VGRTEKLEQKIQELIEKGQKPTASGLAEELSWHIQDVHSLLNSLEKKGEVRSYSKKYRNRKIRFISVKR